MSLRGRGPALVLVLALVIGLLDVGLLWRREGLGSDADGPGGRAGGQPSSGIADTAALDAQLARVAATVEAIRGLRFPTVPRATYLTGDALARRVATFVDEYAAGQEDIDTRVLTALGALPPDYDLRAGLRDLLSEQVAGFYDPDSGEMVVGVGEADRVLSPLEELFLAHELEHALADATLGLPDTDADALDADAAFAATALVEGDASLTMQDYVEVGLSPADQLRLAGESLGELGQLEVLGSVPWVLRRSLEFPYLEGLAFVSQLRALGGWTAVDEAYARPPSNSAAVLFPERYLARTPVAEPPRTGELPPPWQHRSTASFGAADLLFLFEAPGDDEARALDHPRDRAGAWAGGTASLWTQAERSTVVLALVDRGDDQSLCRSMIAWYDEAFPDRFALQGERGERLAATTPRHEAVIRCAGRDVLLGVGPDLDTVRTAIG